jgi:hypothetical protein
VRDPTGLVLVDSLSVVFRNIRVAVTEVRTRQPSLLSIDCRSQELDVTPIVIRVVDWVGKATLLRMLPIQCDFVS